VRAGGLAQAQSQAGGGATQRTASGGGSATRQRWPWRPTAQGLTQRRLHAAAAQGWRQRRRRLGENRSVEHESTVGHDEEGIGTGTNF
jgi:hypothetical protein